MTRNRALVRTKSVKLRSSTKLVALGMAISLTIPGCGERKYSVGTNTHYCPGGHAATVPPGNWVPENQPGIVDGFSFSGCSAQPRELRKQCHLPASMLSADVMNPIAERHLDWADVIQSADLQALLEQTPVHMSAFAPDSVVILGTKGQSAWWVWQLPPQRGGSSLASRLRASRLAAVCFLSKDASAGYLSEADYVCRRSIATSNYAIDYQFGSQTPTPSRESMQNIDSGLIREIESWRCP